MEDGGAAEKGKPCVDDLPTAARALGLGASIVSPPSSPRNPPPVDLATEAKFGGWSSLEEWDDYLAREEEKVEQEKRQILENIEQRKRQFEEKCRAHWAELKEDLDRRRRFEQHLQERESKLEDKMAQLAQQQSEIEKKMKEDRIRLDRWEAEIQRRSEELERQKRELNLNIQVEALDKFVAMQKEQLQKPDRNKNKEEQLQKPLLLQPERNNNKNDGNWSLSHIFFVLAFAGGLILFFQMQAVFPLYYPKFIVDAFAILWALGTVVLSFRISRRYRGKNSFSSYFASFTSLCFTLLGLYALYLISLWFDGTFSGASLSSPEPAVGFGKQW